MHQPKSLARVALALAALTVAVELVACGVTVQIGGATRLTGLNRQRDRFSCYWDCDLVGCKIAHDDDECAYDCEKICRVRYDYAGRSGSSSEPMKPKADSSELELAGKSAGPLDQMGADSGELIAAGNSVRLHLPRNASARNFAIWERCAPDASTGKLTEKPFSL